MVSVYNGGLGSGPPPTGYYTNPSHLWRFNEPSGSYGTILDAVSNFHITTNGLIYQGSGRGSTTGAVFAGGSSGSLDGG